jgi:hypothetical protein
MTTAQQHEEKVARQRQADREMRMREHEGKSEASQTSTPHPDLVAAHMHSPNEPIGSTISGEGGPGAPDGPHTVTSIDPTGAAIGDPDLTLTVTGTGFIDGAQIVFNGGAEETTFVSDTELTTTVKPSTATVAGDYPVTVMQGGFTVDPGQTFTFTEDEPAARSKRGRR